MANPEHVKIVKQGAEAIREWQERTEGDSILDLDGADLRGLMLYGANLVNVEMENADLQGSKFSDVRFSFSHLPKANLKETLFSGCLLDGCNFVESCFAEAAFFDTRFETCDLTAADMSDTILKVTTFGNTQLSRADLTGAHLGNVVFGDMDLRGAIGLDKVQHDAPSTLGIDTIFKSKGMIPEIFLRGCGVPEIMIEYMHSLTGEALQFYKCFISYTEDDNDFSERLYNDLQAKGVRCWRWRDDATWGRTLMREVDQAIRVYDKLIVICSEKSLQSEPVIREIERALQKEQRDQSEVLFPIRVDDSVFEWKHELQADLARKVIGDFVMWKDPGKYRKSLERLIKALQAESRA